MINHIKIKGIILVMKINIKIRFYSLLEAFINKFKMFDTINGAGRNI